ncbi:MAG TPA: peroxidase family protein, partial [Gemmataceae bacterium]|nr:peroxidase family protein [Gemmataceae bacterium]
MKSSFGERLLMAAARRLDRRKSWHQRGQWLGAISLLATRVRLRTWNLVDTDWLPDVEPPAAPKPQPTERQLRARDPAGRFNDLEQPGMGQVGHRFGRNLPLQRSIPELPPALLQPNPRAVSEQLLARGDDFQPVPFLNLLAAAWLQFMIHDWFSHGDNLKENPIEFPVPEGSDWGQPTMRISRTTPDPRRRTDRDPPAYRSTSSAWWDGSQIYGNTPELERKLRSGVDGKMRIESNGLLPLEKLEHGTIDFTGVNANWWIGLSIMHTLFVREHNRICDML